MSLTPEALARCLAAVRSGEMTPEECLAAYPDAAELGDLLAVAGAIAPPPAVAPSAEYRARGRALLLDELRADRRPGVVRWPWAVAHGRLAAAAALAVALLGGGGAAAASQSALPGDPLHPVKLGTEELRLALATDDAARASVALELAGRRVDEIERAQRGGRPDAVAAAAEGFVARVAQADEYLARAAAGRDVAPETARLNAELAQWQPALADAAAAAPAVEVLARARTVAAQGLSTARAPTRTALQPSPAATTALSGAATPPERPTATSSPTAGPPGPSPAGAPGPAPAVPVTASAVPSPGAVPSPSAAPTTSAPSPTPGDQPVAGTPTAILPPRSSPTAGGSPTPPRSATATATATVTSTATSTSTSTPTPTPGAPRRRPPRPPPDSSPAVRTSRRRRQGSPDRATVTRWISLGSPGHQLEPPARGHARGHQRAHTTPA